MTLKSTYTIESVQDLNAMHGLEKLIKAREARANRPLAGLVHELEMLAIKLRKLNEAEFVAIPGFINEHEFQAENIITSKGPTTHAHIQKLFKRWQEVKALIKEIDPEYFLSEEEKITNALSKEIVKEIDDEIVKQILGAACPK